MITELLLKLEFDIECQEKMIDIVFAMSEVDNENVKFLIPLMMVPATVNFFLTKCDKHPEFDFQCYTYC